MLDPQPEDWKQTTVGAVLKNLVGGGTPPREVAAYWNGEIPWASVKDITSRADLPQECVTAEGIANSAARVVPAGTNILAMRMAVGTVARYSRDVAINQDLAALFPSEQLDSDFLFQWLKANSERFKAVATGTTVKGLRKDMLLQWPLALPPLDEQRQIAEVLRSVDAALFLNSGIEAHLTALRETALWELFSATEDEAGELTVVGRLPQGWRVAPAEEVCEAVIDCKNRTPPIVDGGFAVVRTMNVRRGRFVRHNLATTDAASFEEWTKRGKPKPGDILITREAPIGEVCAVPDNEPVCLGQRMMLYRPRETDLVSGFLLYALQSRAVREHLIRLGGGSTVGHVRVGDIRRLPLPLPDLAKQREISDTLRDIDDAIDSVSATIERLRGLKSTLASDLLSGRVRVPT